MSRPSSPVNQVYVPPSDLERELAGQWSDDKLEFVASALRDGDHPDGSRRDGLPLRLAIWQFWTPVLDALLAGGADPNVRASTESEFRVHIARRQDASTTTPLHLAISVAGDLTRRTTAGQEIGLTKFRAENSIKNILKLIGAGADRHAMNFEGESAYGYCSYDFRGRRVSQAVVMPLHAAIELNAPDLCLTLLEAGIDPADKNTRRQTAWRHAELDAPECLAVMAAWESRRTLQAITKQGRLQAPAGGT